MKQAADLTPAAVAALNDTDLAFDFVANSVYVIDLFLMASAASTSTGFRFALKSTVAVTTEALTFEHVLADTGTLTGGHSRGDDAATGLSSGVDTAAAIVMIQGKAILVTGANPGTCRLRFGPEVAAAATLKANSIMRVHKAV